MNNNRKTQIVAVLCLIFLGIASFGGILRGNEEGTKPVLVPVGTPQAVLPGIELSPEMPTPTPEPSPVPETPATPTPPVTPSAEEREPETVEVAPATSSFCNGSYSGQYKTVNGVSYVCAQGVASALDESAHFEVKDGVLWIESEDILLRIQRGLEYFLCNDRYLYAPEGILWEADGVYVPAEALAKCFGATVSQDEDTGYLHIDAEEIVPLTPGAEFYNEDDLYWLSHVIYAESGTETLEGQIAVGNVVINRISSSLFVDQDSIKEVVFAPGQFQVVDNRSIYLEPDAEAIVAAKIALEGYEIIPGALFFAQFSLGSAYITLDWIGAHCFMTLA